MPVDPRRRSSTLALSESIMGPNGARQTIHGTGIVTSIYRIYDPNVGNHSIQVWDPSSFTVHRTVFRLPGIRSLEVPPYSSQISLPVSHVHVCLVMCQKAAL